MKLKLPKYIKEEDTVTSDDDQVENSADEESELIPASVVVVRPTTRALRSSSMLHNYENINGVPTRTTSTLTPTTLRNIEQTFYDLQNETATLASPYQAGFVPPSAPAPSNQHFTQLTSYNTPVPTYHQIQQNIPQHHLHQQQNIPQFLINEQDQLSLESVDDTSSMSESSWHTPPPTMLDEAINNSNSSSNVTLTSNKGRPRARQIEKNASPGSSSSNNSSATPKRNVGGRKPNKSSNLSPEEEEKRRVRRERNKLAAARCRRRREDHTQDLTDETDGLENKKKNLQLEIQQLNEERDHLMSLLEFHKPQCQLPDRQSPPDVKPVISNDGRLAATIVTSTLVQQRPAQTFTATTTINNLVDHHSVNLNNNNHQVMNANALLEKIKVEPLDLYEHDEPPRKKIMFSGNFVDITTPTTPNLPMLHTPTLTHKKARPSSLNVMASMKPSEMVQARRGAELSGVPVQTPSTGMFNFDSLMDGGTGLTPISGPMIPNCSNQNRQPLELQTPTNEATKNLVSL